jgi:hypothetical protein
MHKQKTQGYKMTVSLSFKNNNPGNLRFGSFALRHGATGENGGFAVFPDYITGFNALTTLLGTKTYQKLSLTQAMQQYAPMSENNTENYIKFLENEIGFGRKTLLDDLPIEKLALAIQKFEGWIPE